ncbi:MAG: TolC family protein [Gemmatimonadetes bacterium]|nr:TolC family protein [Gemmatimonadota bacterium]
MVPAGRPAAQPRQARSRRSRRCAALALRRTWRSSARAPRRTLERPVHRSPACQPTPHCRAELARAAEARISAAGRPPDPQLQIGAMNYMLPQLVPMDPLGMVQLQVMQMVPINGTLALATRAAAAQSAAMRARTDEVSWALRNQVAMAFFELSATDRTLDVMRQTLRLLANITETAASMYRVGEGRQVDVLRARVEIARMTEDTIRMQAMRETMVARLNALADRDADIPIGTPLPPRFPDEFPERPWLDSVAALNRPMVRAALEEVRAAEAGERIARRALIPDLQVGVQYGQRGASRFQGDDMAGTQRMGSLMIGASIPIFARSRQLQLREEAAAMRAMAQAEVAVVRAETRGGLGEALAALTRARRLGQLYRTEILPQAEATVHSSLAAYRVGSVDFMTLLDNQMSVNRYRLELATLDADEGKAWVELEMLTGHELFDPNTIARHDAIAPTRSNSAGAPTSGGAP